MNNLKKYWGVLGKYLKKQWPQVTLLGIVFIVGILLQLVIPQIIRFFIDSAKENKSVKVLSYTAVIFIIIAIINQVISVIVTYLSQNIGWKSTNALREDLVKHCFKLDMSFHKMYRPGDLIERIDGDVNSMFNFFSNLLVEVISHITLMIGILTILYIESIYIGITMTVFVLIAMFILSKLQKVAVPYHIKVRKKETEYFGLLGEVLGNIVDISTTGAINKIIYKFTKLNREWLPTQIKSALVSISMWTSTLLIFAIGNALAFGIGGVLWSKGVITVGTVYLIFHYTEMLSMPLREIQYQLTDLQKAGASIERIEEILNVKSKIIDRDVEKLPSGPLSLDLKSLSFEYDKGIKVLKDINFSLEKGTVLGVLGRTGSGKSTLARLVNRLYDATNGEIYIDGKDIKDISIENIRSKIAFVTQDVQLFNATIRDNLTFFNKEITDDEIWNALRYMGIDKWIKKLPNSLDTHLKSDGGGLSAGEAQLIAFVRVFLKDPGIIILDEASSRLDPLTEQIMESAISKLFENRTGIIIAHRLQTVERADKILILENGKIIEYGDKDYLETNKDSHFKKLLSNSIKEVLA